MSSFPEKFKQCYENIDIKLFLGIPTPFKAAIIHVVILNTVRN